MIVNVTPVSIIRTQRRWSHTLALALTVAATLAVTLAVAGCTSTPTTRHTSTDGSQIGGPTAPRTTTGPASGSGLIPPDADLTGAADATGRGDALPAPDNSRPDAPALAWLDGPMPQPGLVIDHGATTRWQGRLPGEHATLGNGWYRYFGSDGSLVGCTSADSCVGIGADGSVAVVTRPGSVRTVYDAEGEYLGRYDSQGAKLPSPTTAPDLVEALADSGVDLAGLLDAATRAPSFSGAVTGDPHLVTMDGVRIATQVSGRYVARSGDPARTLQLELASMPHRDTVSIVTGLAVETRADTVVMTASGTLRINGLRQSTPPSFEETQLGAGVTAGFWPATSAVSGGSDGVDGSDIRGTLVLVWPDGGALTAVARGALGLTVISHLPPVESVGGLFGSPQSGSADGSATIGLTARDGSAATTSQAVLSWRVNASTDLFPQDSGVSTVIPSTAADPDEAAVAAGRALCRTHRIRRVTDVNSCGFDIAVTGDVGFIPGHVAMALAAESPPVPASVAHHWPALLRGSVIGAPALPADGQVDQALPAGSTRAYRATLRRAGSVTVTARDGCGADEQSPGRGAAALRLFDSFGHPVSPRWPLCGSHTSSRLSAGNYSLVLAGPVDGPDADARLRIELP